MQGEDLIILLVFGISALLVPVWLFLNGKKIARERIELERQAGLEEQPADEKTPDLQKDDTDKGQNR